MSTESKGTLVVPLDFIERYDKALTQLQRNASPKYKRLYEAQQDALTTLRRGGTTVPLDHLTVVELATPVRETPWQRQERAQECYYSEADSADAAAWEPAGGGAA